MHMPIFVDNSPEYTRQSIENCLKLIGDKGKIDMWEIARRDTQEDYVKSLRVIDEYVKQGKIGGVSLSEVNANSIRQATKVVKVVGVEIELSLFQTDPLHNGVCAACAEFDIPIFAYSPLGVSPSSLLSASTYPSLTTLLIEFITERISHGQGPEAGRPLFVVPKSSAFPRGELQCQPQAGREGQRVVSQQGLHPSPVRIQQSSNPHFECSLFPQNS